MNKMLTEEITRDIKLQPLFDGNSIIALQFFILEIIEKRTRQEEYKIVYGWAIKSTKESCEEILYCSSQNEVFSTSKITYSIYRVSLYHNKSVIIKFVNGLTKGNSFKQISSELGLNSSKVKFDLKYIEDNKHSNKIVLRPLIFNEPSTILSENYSDPKPLYSPYKNIPSISLIINYLDKFSIFKDGNQEFYSDWKLGLIPILDFLYRETTLPFSTTNPARFGNIEFINTQCSNEFEVHNVWFETQKKNVEIRHREILSCNTVKVLITPNIYTENKELIINCLLTNGGQVILDDCKEIKHKPGTTLEVEFECKEPISQIFVKVWIEEKNLYSIWYKYSAPLIRTSIARIGMVGINGDFKSDWLKTIENSNNKTKPHIKEAQKVAKSSYSTVITGNFETDPWVSADREFSSFIADLAPVKSDAEFFPKGWSSEDEEHGTISFLNWFKKITDKSEKVIIQDPFYDTLGLDFLIRATNASTSFNILTCTQVNSSDDEIDDAFNEPNRATRIKKYIADYPSLFDSLKLNIYDLRSTGGGDKNLLHDRYMLLFEKDSLVKGFHLSNSIQGASKYHPLLITPIPRNILNKVNQHISQIIQGTGPEKDVQIIPLTERKVLANRNTLNQNFPANSELYEILNTQFHSVEAIQKENISFIVTKLSESNQEEFNEIWSTIGHFLANVHFSDEFLKELQVHFSPELISKLTNFLKLTISNPQPIGFSNNSLNYRHHFHTLLYDSFNESLKNAMSYRIFFGESNGDRNWGCHYASKLLLTVSIDEYLKLFEFLKIEIKNCREKDISRTPIFKLTSIVFHRLARRLFWRFDLSSFEKCLMNEISGIRALSCAGLISAINNSESEIQLVVVVKLIKKNLSTDEVLFCLASILFECKKQNNQIEIETENKVFDSIKLTLLEKYTERRLTLLLNTLDDPYYPLIEKKISEKILYALLENEKINRVQIFDIWSKKFSMVLKQFKSYSDYSGLLDILGESFCMIDSPYRTEFIKHLEKQIKSDFNVIRKPFNKGSESWLNSYERILLIQSFFVKSIIYNGQNSSKIVEEIDLRNKIDSIQKLKDQFQFQSTYSEIQKFNNQVHLDYLTLSA